MSRSNQMIIDVVNDRDEVVGQVQRSEVFRVRANFRVTHVFLFNLRGELLLQQIAPGNRHAGLWGSSVATYLLSGEDYYEGAIRSLNEEIGVRAVALDRALYLPMDDSGCTKFITLFTTSGVGPFTPDPSEVSAIEFRAVDELLSMIEYSGSIFTPTFKFLIDRFTFPARRLARA